MTDPDYLADDDALADDPELWRDFIDTYAQRVSHNAWQPYSWLQYLCPILEEFAVKPRGRLLLNVPPRHGKSWTTSQYLPAWYINQFNDHKVMLTSYEADYAATWGGRVRDIALADQDLAGIHFAPKYRPSMSEWETREQGGMFTAGVGGPITGRGAHLIIIDDPHKNYEEASSPVMLAKIQNWYESTLYTRQEPGASLVVIQTRWNENDLTGWLLDEHANEDWTHIVIPARCDDPATDSLHRAYGQALCPERYTAQDLQAIEDNLDATIWQGLYQQRPQPPGGTIWQQAWLEANAWLLAAELPTRWDEVLLSVDAAFKDKVSNSFVVLQVWGRAKGHYYLLHQVREHIGFIRTLDEIAQALRTWPVVSKLLIEDKANGIPIIELLKTMPGRLGHIEIVPITPKSSKEARGRAASPIIRAGHVHIPHTDRYPWVKAYLHEVCMFPNAKHDDQFDCSSQVLNYWALAPGAAGGNYGTMTRNLAKTFQKMANMRRLGFLR